MTDRGSYLEYDGRPAVRFERTYPHPIERVWRAVSEPGEMAHWFPARVSHDSRAGGPITFSGDPYADDLAATVLVWEPPHRFAFGWGADEVHLTLEETAEGCRLVLVDVLEERAAAARNAAGWHACLDQLDLAVAGTPGAGPHSAEANPWQPTYDAYVAAGLPSGAALPGY
jgi:uncharacterized protein YndB with AHSA1/START domain